MAIGILEKPQERTHAQTPDGLLGNLGVGGVGVVAEAPPAAPPESVGVEVVSQPDSLEQPHHSLPEAPDNGLIDPADPEPMPSLITAVKDSAKIPRHWRGVHRRSSYTGKHRADKLSFYKGRRRPSRIEKVSIAPADTVTGRAEVPGSEYAKAPKGEPTLSWLIENGAQPGDAAPMLQSWHAGGNKVVGVMISRQARGRHRADDIRRDRQNKLTPAQLAEAARSEPQLAALKVLENEVAAGGSIPAEEAELLARLRIGNLGRPSEERSQIAATAMNRLQSAADRRLTGVVDEFIALERSPSRNELVKALYPGRQEAELSADEQLDVNTALRNIAEHPSVKSAEIESLMRSAVPGVWPEEAEVERVLRPYEADASRHPDDRGELLDVLHSRRVRVMASTAQIFLEKGRPPISEQEVTNIMFKGSKFVDLPIEQKEAVHQVMALSEIADRIPKPLPIESVKQKVGRIFRTSVVVGAMCTSLLGSTTARTRSSSQFVRRQDELPASS